MDSKIRMYPALLKPVACDATQKALHDWAHDTRGLIVAQHSNTGPSWQKKDHDEIFIKMIGTWKSVVFFIKTKWEGEVEDALVTFIFKVEAKFHISGMYEAEISIVPESKREKPLDQEPLDDDIDEESSDEPPIDPVLDIAVKMDGFRKKLTAKTAEELQAMVVKELPKVIDDALASSVATAIMLPRPQ